MNDRIDIRTLAIDCRNGLEAPTFEETSRRDEWNVYAYRCAVGESGGEASSATLLIEVPRDLDVTPDGSPVPEGADGSEAAATEAAEEDEGAPPRFNLRNLSIRCASCPGYPILAAFRREEDHNVYTYECEQQPCRSGVGEILLTVPHRLDAFARRDPTWRGGGRHGEEGDGSQEG